MKEVVEKQSFGERLRLARERTGLSQGDFGILGGVTKSSQYLYESGERLPDVDYLHRLRKHLQLDLNELVSGEASSRVQNPTQLQLDSVMKAFADYAAAESGARRLTETGRINLFQRLLLKASLA